MLQSEAFFLQNWPSVREVSVFSHALFTLHCTPTMVRKHVNLFCRVAFVATRSTFSSPTLN
jgi:hypothetical protein